MPNALLYHHEDFFTPGSSPRDAISLKQILHILKSLMYALFLPQRKQRRIIRELNFGFFFAFAINAVLAMMLGSRR
ncbi:hypothetical protein A3A21_00970 [Candidatus Jorgensenbacteria bacterium RIFCSPLOWO2_01_FULL_45_25b]|uniref:Uncharacterized protein n=1 Tax=Candidatus Jorgensenbacteria bacterium RIFCSPLOWO2_01_FULL_45_25b TaxID=1798471 RepID=A0A1F6BW96_9BACT|nr:MAG: hypothetical protein A3A21_00970 [Candidatus Jorgensenbacteria bacterium RIFCSPLOWO2_01_FULL_45_25b]